MLGMAYALTELCVVVLGVVLGCEPADFGLEVS